MRVRPWLILAAMVLARIGFGYQYQTVATLGPQLVRQFDLDYATLGTLIGAYMLLGGFLAIPLGLLSRRLGDRLVLTGGLVLMVLGPLLNVIIEGPTGIGIGRSVAGVGGVAMIVLQNKIIADWFADRWFMWAISVSVAAYPIGVGLAQLVLPPLALAYGWQVCFLSGAIPIAVALVLFLGSFRSSPLTPQARTLQITERTRVPLAVGRRPHLDRLYCRLFGIHRVRSIGDGGPWREPGLDRTRPDHRHLGQRSRHHAGRRPDRPLRRIPYFPPEHRRSGHRHARCRPTGPPRDVRVPYRDRRILSSRRDHRNRHPISATREPRRWDGAVLFHVLRRRCRGACTLRSSS